MHRVVGKQAGPTGETVQPTDYRPVTCPDFPAGDLAAGSEDLSACKQLFDLPDVPRDRRVPPAARRGHRCVASGPQCGAQAPADVRQALKDHKFGWDGTHQSWYGRDTAYAEALRTR
jgi:hypothetical protein